MFTFQSITNFGDLKVFHFPEMVHMQHFLVCSFLPSVNQNVLKQLSMPREYISREPGSHAQIPFIQKINFCLFDTYWASKTAQRLALTSQAVT